LPWQSVPVQHVVLSTGLKLGAVMIELEKLEADGWLSLHGGWIERIGRGGAR
jgi:hypothetical protein